MFKSPEAPAKWKGVKDATKKAAACLQFQPTGVKNSQPTSLDCLYLDIYRPAKAKKGQKFPVMVFYHGGASTQGSGVLYGGQTLANRTNTILVSTNYRLGASGGLSLPALDTENPTLGSGNYAVQDQIQTLRFLQKTISSFGGDKNNVTIFGQSAGGQAVCNLLASPLSRGLFDKAIIESANCSSNPKTLANQQEQSAKFANAAGCPATDPNVLSCLRNAWPAALVTAQQQFPVTGGVTGTGVLPVAPGVAISSGSWNKVPIVIGNVRWEQKLQNIQYANITAAQYDQLLIDTYGTAGATYLQTKYPASAYPAPFYALAAVKTDIGAGCTTGTLANVFRSQVKVYRYEFNDPTSPTLFGFQPAGIDMSSAHSGELAYLFDFTLGNKPLTAKQNKLAHSMQDYWAAFARNGSPYVKGAATWPRYTSTNKAIVLAPTIGVTDQLNVEHNCDFIAALPPKA
jgi:para-nitrobenzyl esterase